MDKLKYKTKMSRYGFNIEFVVNRQYSGFYWEAKSFNRKEVGYIDFYMIGKNRNIFVETAFTPLEVKAYPKFTPSGDIVLLPETIESGKWILSFINIISSSATIQIIGSQGNSYSGINIAKNINLKNTGFIKIEIKIINQINKLFIKKSNFSKSIISLSDFSLYSLCSKRNIVSDKSLILLETENIEKNNQIVSIFPQAKIWSFFSIKFYDPTTV